ARTPMPTEPPLTLLTAKTPCRPHCVPASMVIEWTAHQAARMPPPEAATMTRGSTRTLGVPAAALAGAAIAQDLVSGSASHCCRLPARVAGPDGVPAPGEVVVAAVLAAGGVVPDVSPP